MSGRRLSRFTSSLPADPHTSPAPRQVTGAAFSWVDPTPVRAPTLLAYTHDVAELVGLAGGGDDPAVVAALAGNQTLDDYASYATCYGGHQFGQWAGQLGDGRAIIIAERTGPSGRRYELQLKGAGPTPYSRGADGRAVLRSSLREFVCSEAMHHLGVPTTRALSLVRTGESVIRDMFYDGNAAPEPGAIVCRVAPTFMRFGHFQIAAARGDHGLLRQLTEFALAHAAEWDEDVLGVARCASDTPVFAPTASDPGAVVAWFRHVAARTAELVAEWMRVGFVHGVMNTDNMSVAGVTIDYGPYGWLDDFDPGWTPNTTDASGRRYRFGAQPQIAGWNLARFAESLVPLVGDRAPLVEAMELFQEVFLRAQARGLAGKLGLRAVTDEDDALIDELFQMIAAVETDMTIFFRALADVTSGDASPDDVAPAALLGPIVPALYAPDALDHGHRTRLVAWLRVYLKRVARDGRESAERRAQMNAFNPVYVPRNYLTQQAIDAAGAGDLSELEALIEVLRTPYVQQPGRERFAAPRPGWARHRPGCSVLSCSS